MKVKIAHIDKKEGIVTLYLNPRLRTERRELKALFELVNNASTSSHETMFGNFKLDTLVLRLPLRNRLISKD